MSEKTGIGVIGSGYWGKNLVRNYHQLGVLKLICDKNEEILGNFREKYPDVETCLALNDVLARDDIHGVVVATPAETHYRLAMEALFAGKHVYVEKPLVLDETEGEELIGLAEENQRVLMVGHLLQYHPVFDELKKLAGNGDLGRINYIYSQRLNLGKIRREENILWSFAPHDISMILELAREEPETVMASGGNYLHKRIADVTTTHMEFPSGLQAHIFVSWLHPFKEQKLVVVGEKKMAVFDDTKPWKDKLLLYPHEIKWQNNVPVPTKGEPERVDISEAEPLRLECEHFLACLTNGQRPTTDGWEGLRVLKVLNAAQRSLNQDGAKIIVNPAEEIWKQRAGDRDQMSDVRRQRRGQGDGREGKDRDQMSDVRNRKVGGQGRLEDQMSDVSLRPVGAYPPACMPHGQEAAPVGGRKEEEKRTKRQRSESGGSGCFVHDTAVIDDGCKIGRGTKIWHFSHILSNSRIGENCNIGQNVVIGPDVEIGKGCKVQNNVSVYKGVTLEDGVFCGPSMVFTNIYNPRAEIRKMDQVRTTLAKRGATIGANATIICGITIGRYSFIGAGTVVTKDVPDYALVVGNPGKQIGWVCECGERLEFGGQPPARRGLPSGLYAPRAGSGPGGRSDVGCQEKAEEQKRRRWKAVLFDLWERV